MNTLNGNVQFLMEAISSWFKNAALVDWTFAARSFALIIHLVEDRRTRKDFCAYRMLYFNQCSLEHIALSFDWIGIILIVPTF
jgi:hypothetical protein